MEPRPPYRPDPPAGPAARDVYTPTRLNREARALLEQGLPGLWLEGEISNLSRPSSGHWYFSLKDTGAQLRCAMFRQRNLAVRFVPKDGQLVLARGRVSLYEPRGDYQFIVEHLEEAGEGALKRQFEVLKTRLAAAGLFAPEHKKPLPRLPRRIGVVTSPTGAALRDILNILRRRFPAIPVLLYPVPVQGAGAAEEIATALRLAGSRRDCDVLILARGGGSLEDLWSFNEESVARALFECPLPVVSGVGHEIDFTIADFVADVRAPTPSGAAELVVPDRDEWLRLLDTLERRLHGQARRRVGLGLETLARLQRRFERAAPAQRLRQQTQRLDDLEQRLVRALKHLVTGRRAVLQQQAGRLKEASPALRLAAIRGQLGGLEIRIAATVRSRLERSAAALAVAGRTLNAVSPLATLDRGYAIVKDGAGRVAVDATALAAGANVDVRLSRGRFSARVIETSTPENETRTGEKR